MSRAVNIYTDLPSLIYASPPIQTWGLSLHPDKVGAEAYLWEQRQIYRSRAGGGGERLELDLWSHPLPALQYPVEA